MRYMRIGDREIGDGHPCYIVGEIGLNHNGDVNIALELMTIAKDAGFDAVKFQKRDPDICTPRDQRDKMRDTPWGYIRYIEYRRAIEFWEGEYALIDECAQELGIQWFASVWDEPSVSFMDELNTLCYKIPSAMVTNLDVLRKIKRIGRPVIMSTGMSTEEEIGAGFQVVGGYAGADNIGLLHCTSTYPCSNKELNLSMIDTLKHMDIYDGRPIGYSGHEVSLTQSVAAVAIGAQILERHITLDRTMWGSDHAASVEPNGMRLLVKRIRRLEESMGDGIKRVYDSEKDSIAKLRGRS